MTPQHDMDSRTTASTSRTTAPTTATTPRGGDGDPMRQPIRAPHHDARRIIECCGVETSFAPEVLGAEMMDADAMGTGTGGLEVEPGPGWVEHYDFAAEGLIPTWGLRMVSGVGEDGRGRDEWHWDGVGPATDWWRIVGLLEKMKMEAVAMAERGTGPT